MSEADAGGEKETHLAWFEFVLDAVLKAFLFQLRAGDHETVADEVRRVPVAFRCAEPVEIRLLLLDHAVSHGVDAEPGGDCETVLVGPCLDGRKDDAGAVAAGKVEEFVGSLTVREVLEDVQQFDCVLFLQVERVRRRTERRRYTHPNPIFRLQVAQEKFELVDIDREGGEDDENVHE